MKNIKLTKNQIAVVDDWNYERINKNKWSAQWDEKTQKFYAIRVVTKPFRKKIWMHREIANTPNNMECDHKNHDTLYNVENNLRNATHSQNCINRKYSPNKLGEKNIYQYKTGFQVSIKYGGKVVYDKTFKNIDDAILARDKALKKYHGEFSYRRYRE